MHFRFDDLQQVKYSSAIDLFKMANARVHVFTSLCAVIISWLMSVYKLKHTCILFDVSSMFISTDSSIMNSIVRSIVNSMVNSIVNSMLIRLLNR